MADIALQRKNMVESQARPSDVTDRRILAAMREVPREEFVPDDRRSLAYMDGDVRLTAAAPGKPARFLMAPRIFAKLIDLAQAGPSDVVLDVGTGSGYSAAVLGKLVETVVALETDAGLAAKAVTALAALALDNVGVVQGDLAKGWPAAGPYAAIIVEGAIAVVPDGLLAQLADGGRLVAVLTEGASSSAMVWQRRGAAFDRRAAFDATAPRLPGFDRPTVFSL